MKANKKLPKIKGAQFYKIGDKVEAIKTKIGAWFTADIIDISPNSKCECVEFCNCTYKLLFEGDEDNMEIVNRKLNEIRQVSYSSIDWDHLEVGMKVVINYNIEKPKQWGYWYDYVIEDLQKRDDVIYLKGALLVGYEWKCRRISVRIDSDNVSDVLQIRPHATLQEKEAEGYETGVKPDYCKRCKNKPKVKCKKCCCCKCGNKKDFELTVQCDECDDWYHIYCLEPPLRELPNDEDWYCPKCNNETRRAKLEMKLKLKKQKQSLRGESKSPRKVKETKEPCTREVKSPVLEESDHSESEGELEIKEITQDVPQGIKIWNDVEKLYDHYEVLRIVAEVVRKKVSKILPPEVEELIEKDEENEHLWKEAKESIPQGKVAFLQAVKRIFTCAICCDLLDDPITLSCKHNFCIDCFFRSLAVNVYNCALCRVNVINTKHYVVNEHLQKALALLFEKKLSKKVRKC